MDKAILCISSRLLIQIVLLMSTDFAPSFNVSWDTPAPSTPSPSSSSVPSTSSVAQKPKLDAFGVDEAFSNFKPNFSTEVEQLKLVQPNPVPPIEDISNTAAAKIFSDFCQNKFGFTPVFDQK